MAETNGLLNRRACHVNHQDAETYNRQEPSPVGQHVDAQCVCNELAAVIAAWADLPEHIRQAILTLIEAVVQGNSANE